jgi:hypothetical protein
MHLSAGANDVWKQLCLMAIARSEDSKHAALVLGTTCLCIEELASKERTTWMRVVVAYLHAKDETNKQAGIEDASAAASRIDSIGTSKASEWTGEMNRVYSSNSGRDYKLDGIVYDSAKGEIVWRQNGSRVASFLIIPLETWFIRYYEKNPHAANSPKAFEMVSQAQVIDRMHRLMTTASAGEMGRLRA